MTGGTLQHPGASGCSAGVLHGCWDGRNRERGSRTLGWQERETGVMGAGMAGTGHGGRRCWDGRNGTWGFCLVPLHGQGMVQVAHAARPHSGHPGCSRELCPSRSDPVLPHFLSGVLLQSRNSALSTLGRNTWWWRAGTVPAFGRAGWAVAPHTLAWEGQSLPGAGQVLWHGKCPGFTGALPVHGLIKGPG